MYLESLYLKNFRNYRETAFYFSPHTNRILGENGQGKTNLLEAIYFLSTGRSFRTKNLFDLIYHDEEYFYIEAHFVKDKISQSLKITFQKKRKKFQYNHTVYSNFSHLFGILPSVIFAPSDVNIIGGAPLDRRRFLNMHLAQIDPLYVFHLGRYHRALKQRNALLKQKKIATLDIWEQQMAHSALFLMQSRADYISKIMQEAPLFLEKISGRRDPFSIQYSPSIPLDFKQADPTQYITAFYKKNREKELQFATTLIGPHRDDFCITMENKEAKGFSSEGQKRTILAALKCAEWHRLKDRSNALPLLSIDDFGAHLDQKRLELFQKEIENKTQIFLTMPLNLAQSPFSKEEKTLCIHEGSLLE